MEHLYSGRDMRATLLCPKTESPSQTLFVTFSNFRSAPSLEDDGFGQDLIKKWEYPPFTLSQQATLGFKVQRSLTSLKLFSKRAASSPKPSATGQAWAAKAP